MQRLTELLPTADGSSVLPSVMKDASAMSYQPIVGHDGTNFVLGSRILIRHVPDNGESLNGQDDNGDGRTDEGYLNTAAVLSVGIGFKGTWPRAGFFIPSERPLLAELGLSQSAICLALNDSL